jgi:hypothetical protein
MVQRAASSSSFARLPDYVVYLISTQRVEVKTRIVFNNQSIFAFKEASAAPHSRLVPDVCRGARCWRVFVCL